MKRNYLSDQLFSNYFKFFFNNSGKLMKRQEENAKANFENAKAIFKNVKACMSKPNCHPERSEGSR